MKILIGYATNSSGTLVASTVLTKTLKEKGIEIIHKEIRGVKPDSLNQYDLIILGSCSWNYNKTEGMPHEYMSAFMASMNQTSLPEKPFAVFGLGDTAYMYFCGAVDHMETFVYSIHGRLVVPSLRIDGFFFDQQQNENRLREWAELIYRTCSQNLFQTH